MLKKKIIVNEAAPPTPATPPTTPPNVYQPVSPSPSVPHPGFNPQQTAPWTRPPEEGDTVVDKQGNTWVWTKNPDGTFDWRRLPRKTPGRINPQSPNRRPGRGYGPA
jgi:hypothetical protein